MSAWLARLNITNPVLAAPMAGGPGSPELVVAATRAGSLGFLAGGYKTPAALAAELTAVRDSTTKFGVNLFAPNPVPVDPAAFRRYAAALRPDAERYGLQLPDEPSEDDDHWQDKVELLRTQPVPIVSFTFGIPDPSTIAALHKAGTLLVQTVTSAAEARAADAVGLDALVVQAAAAGGHSGTLTPQRPPADVRLEALIASVRAVTRLPILAAGGLSTPAAVAAAMAAGAEAVLVGTVLLRTPESGTSAVYRAALAGPDRGATVLTRAFTGRPARALPNEFIARHDAIAPEGYPALHHLTSPLRRAATAAGNPELVNLWAGTGYREATDDPAAVVLDRLAADV